MNHVRAPVTAHLFPPPTTHSTTPSDPLPPPLQRLAAEICINRRRLWLVFPKILSGMLGRDSWDTSKGIASSSLPTRPLNHPPAPLRRAGKALPNFAYICIHLHKFAYVMTVAGSSARLAYQASSPKRGTYFDGSTRMHPPGQVVGLISIYAN